MLTMLTTSIVNVCVVLIHRYFVGYLWRTRVMYGLRNSELSTCLFQFSHKTRQTMLLYAYFTPKVDANLTTSNRFFTNDDWQRGRFENFESDHQYESNLESDVRFEIESNHEASQVPTKMAIRITLRSRRRFKFCELWVDCREIRYKSY